MAMKNKILLAAWLAAVLIFLFGSEALAQAQDGAGNSAGNETSTTETASDSIFPHLHDGRFWVSGQANFIYQTHPSFYAKYTGPNSLVPNYEKAISRVLSLYTGVQLTRSMEVLATVEDASGTGMSNSLGMAGYANLDVVRVPGEGSPLSTAPYLARVIFHKVISLSSKKIGSDRGPTSTFTELPERRIEIRAGKFDTVDFFDQNSVGSDSHLQFMNWATAENGAYDYAADTRGYTWGVVVEYQARNCAFRVGEMLMPKVANGIDMEWDLRKAHADNFEFELRQGLLPKKDGTVRVLSFINHANMGIYRDTVAQYEAGLTATPEIAAHPWQTTIKYGFGMNLEQSLATNFKAFARWGWNNGKTESFAYTEIDSTFAVGLGLDGHQWHRNKDRAGVAFVSNAISKDHQNYLADGGVGFIIGDGALNYGREQIIESYYTAHVWRGLYAGPDLQYVTNPAYNRDRGPVLVPGFRVHVEL